MEANTVDRSRGFSFYKLCAGIVAASSVVVAVSLHHDAQKPAAIQTVTNETGFIQAAGTRFRSCVVAGTSAQGGIEYQCGQWQSGDLATDQAKPSAPVRF